jgi:hypothetical protein
MPASALKVAAETAKDACILACCLTLTSALADWARIRKAFA